MGLALFARSTRSLGLTEAGRRLHARARAVRDAAESARLALRHTRDQLDGTIRISATAGFGRHVLAPLLARFQALHPAVRYELFFTDRRVDLLREGLDIAFRVTNQPPESWVALAVLKFEVRAYGSGPHARARPERGAFRKPMVARGWAARGRRTASLRMGQRPGWFDRVGAPWGWIGRCTRLLR